jgi:hypothetical protein
MSGVYYFNCDADGGRQVEHSNSDPTAPCPICHIAQIEAELTALREAVSGMNPNNPFSVIDVQIMVEGGDE